MRWPVERLRSLSPLRVEPCVVNRARNLVRNDGHEVTLMLTKRARHGTLDREHADEIVADEQWNGDLAFRVREARNGDRLSELRTPTSLFHLASLSRSVGALLPQIADVHHPTLLRDHADHSGPNLDASADGLIFVAPACDDP